MSNVNGMDINEIVKKARTGMNEGSYGQSFESLWKIANLKNMPEVPILLKGKPGIGKTAMVDWLAKKLGYELVTIVVADSDPCDMSGVWTSSLDGTSAVRLTPQKLIHDKPIVIFLDEFTAGSPEQMAAAAKLTDGSRMIGDYKIHDESIIIAAINPDHAIGAASKIPAPLLTRFRHVDVDCDQAVSWMCRQEGMIGTVGAWLTQSPESAIDGDDVISAAVDEIKPFACPRTWTRAALQYPDDLDMWTQYVGASAVKFVDWYSGINLPSPREILDLGTAEVPERDDLVHVAGISAAAKITTPEQAVNLMRWIDKCAVAGKLGSTRLATRQMVQNSSSFKEFQNHKWEALAILTRLFQGRVQR